MNLFSRKFQSRHSFGPEPEMDPAELRRRVETHLKILNISDLESLAKFYAFECENFVVWCSGMSVKKCCENTRIIVHVEYSGCVVFPQRRQEWPGAGAGWVMMLRAPQVAEFYKNSVSYDGFLIEFSRNYKMFNYDSSRIPLGFAVDIALEATKYKRLAQKAWPKTGPQPLCSNLIEESSKCFEQCYSQAIILSPCKCSLMGSGHFYAQKTCFDDQECFKAETIRRVQKCESQCRPACEEWIFHKTVTFNQITLEGNFSDRSVLLRIAFPRLMYNFLEEQETQTLDLAVGNIGGQLGLWLGGSFLSLMQTLVLICHVTAKKFWNRNK